MTAQNDRELLNHYIASSDSNAFSQLVSRHIDFVYSAALRQVGNRADLAEDVTQAVFILLSRKAGSIQQSSLPGWLFNTTRYAARNAMRAETTRKRHEQLAAQQRDQNLPPPDWNELSEQIDEAVSRLKGGDRDVILLHYYNGHSLSDAATVLGITHEVARKRASRAIERLRGFFKAGTPVMSAAGLIAAISANAVHAAPVGLTQTVVSAAGGTAGASVLGIVQGVIKMKMIIGMKIAAAVSIVMLGASVLMVAAQQDAPPAPQAAASSTAPAAAPVPFSLDNVRTYHARLGSFQQDQPQTSEQGWDQYYERGKGHVYIQYGRGGTFVRFNDGESQWLYNTTGHGLGKPDGLISRRRSGSVQQAAESVKLMANRWMSMNPIPDPGRDEMIDGEFCRYFRLSPTDDPARGRIRGGITASPGEAWIDLSGRLRRNITFQSGSTSRFEIRYDLPPADSWFPKIDPNAPNVVDPAGYLAKQFPLENALYKRETIGLIFAVHHFQRDETGAYHIIWSLRLGDAVRTAKPDMTMGLIDFMLYKEPRTNPPLRGAFEVLRAADCKVQYAVIKPELLLDPQTFELTVRVESMSDRGFEAYPKTSIGSVAEAFQVKLDTPAPKQGLTNRSFIEQAYEAANRLNAVTEGLGGPSMRYSVDEYAVRVNEDLNRQRP